MPENIKARIATLKAIATEKRAEWAALEADIARLNEAADNAAHSVVEAENEVRWLMEELVS